MNIRHAAALALVGWYLMVPPIAGHVPSVNVDASLSKWEIRSVFDTQKGCENEKADEIDNVAERAVSTGSVELCADCFMRCIATDDPRLKKK